MASGSAAALTQQVLSSERCRAWKASRGRPCWAVAWLRATAGMCRPASAMAGRSCRAASLLCARLPFASVEPSSSQATVTRVSCSCCLLGLVVDLYEQLRQAVFVGLNLCNEVRDTACLRKSQGWWPASAALRRKVAARSTSMPFTHMSSNLHSKAMPGSMSPAQHAHPEHLQCW